MCLGRITHATVMLMLTRRLQVLVDEERYAALEREAKRAGTSVGFLVRAAIDDRLAPIRAGGAGAGERLLGSPPMPVGEPEELAEEIERMHDRWPR